MSRHLTPEEIALNQRELVCSSEIEVLEIQGNSLESELEQDIDDMNWTPFVGPRVVELKV